MKNSEVIVLTETVNDILQTKDVNDSQLDSVIKYADMGVNETGKTGYRLIHILATELQKTRGGLVALVNESSKESLSRAAETLENERDDSYLEEDGEEELTLGDASVSVLDLKNDTVGAGW